LGYFNNVIKLISSTIDSEEFTQIQWVFEKLPTMTNQDDMRKLTPAGWVETLQDVEEAAA
jgi:hypothetical protein